MQSPSSPAWSPHRHDTQPSFVAVNADAIGDGTPFFGAPLAPLTRCYDAGKNYTTRVVGHAIHAACYVSAHVMHYHTNYTAISRCGHCVALTGPSERPLICMVAGFFAVTGQHDSAAEEKAILVDDASFEYVASSVVHKAATYTPVTIRMVDCPFNAVPSIDVIRRDAETITLQLINTNTIVRHVIVDGAICTLDTQACFVLSSTHTTRHVRVVSIFDDVVSGDLRPAQDTLVFPANFPTREQEPCRFATTNILFVDEEQPDTDPHFAWHFFVENSPGNNSTGTLVPATQTPDFIEISPRADTVAVHMVSPTFMDFTKHLHVLTVDVLLTERVEFVRADFIAANTSSDGAPVQPADVLCTATTMVNYTRASVDRTRVFVHFKVAVPKRCRGVGNVVRITLRTPGRASLRIVRATADNTLEALPDCRAYCFDCMNTSCTSNNSTRFDGYSKFREGCEPFCGYCPFGYECSSSGNCLPAEQTNRRNAAACVLLVLTLFLIVLCYGSM